MKDNSSFDTYADKHPRTLQRLNISAEQLRALFSRPIAYNKLFAIAGGSVGAGVFLSQLVYWTETKEDPNEWIYKTRDDWWIETALGRYELETIRKALVSRGLIEEKYYGVPPKLYYRVNWNQLSIAVAEAIQMHSERVSKRGAPTNQFLVRPVSASKPVATPPPSGGNATTKTVAPPPDIYRSESTTQSTKTKSAAPAKRLVGYKRQPESPSLRLVVEVDQEGEGPGEISQAPPAVTATPQQPAMPSLAVIAPEKEGAVNGHRSIPLTPIGVDPLLAEFGPFNAKQRRYISDWFERDPDYVERQAEIVRSEPRKKAAQAFLAAIRDDWQPATKLNIQEKHQTDLACQWSPGTPEAGEQPSAVDTGKQIASGLRDFLQQLAHTA